MIWAGNIYPNYEDVRGSISRRIAKFEFNNVVTETDGTLVNRILENELGHVFIKCVSLYRLEATRHQRGRFVDFAPAYFRNALQQTTEALNPFAKWLNGDEDDNRTPYGSVYIEEAPGGFECVSDLKKEFENYCRLQTPGKTKTPSWEKIYSDPLLKRGFRIKQDVNMCKSCNKPAKAGCCEQYSPQNRSKRHIVHNIRIVRKTNEVSGV
ncbi:hypothetical protein HK102_003863 [Quaeritorhiza haematococci]|nr:hypothetical protein HK102_003863 [Quaeritorhiza haematococci]